MSERIVIVAASARAAAFSALRAGFTPLCADLFADVDLRQVASVQTIRNYPEGAEIATRSWSDCPVVYGGGFEIYPEIVDCIAAARTLYGNDGDVLRRIGNPNHVSQVLAAANLRAPKVSASADDLARDGSWLQKPLRGAGGVGIEPLSLETRLDADVYYQQRIEGTPCSGVFVASNGRAELIGATRQLVGEQWTRAGKFQYAGSIGPLTMSHDCQRQWRSIGCELALRFDLVGIFGVDAVLNNDGIWPVEVNPRYPASAEVLERAGCSDLMRQHVEACRSSLMAIVFKGNSKSLYGKAILHASQDVVVPESLTALAVSSNVDVPWPEFGDIPHPGEAIRARRPIMTMFASGRVFDEVEDELKRKVLEVEALLYA
jgi:predicted ATP-grasp superfamily ATP-dependent carboligase